MTRLINVNVTPRFKLRRKRHAAIELCLTVFALCVLGWPQPAQAQTETVLHAFLGAPGDGAYPIAALVLDKQGNLYGPTLWGGAYDYGTIFKLSPDGIETVLYSFGQPGDGRYPYTTVVLDRHGDLYGTTAAGGTYGRGTIFKLSPDGSETVLHHFKGAPEDGADPAGSLVLDKRGTLYGIAAGGAYAGGMVFKLTPDGTETVLYSFKSYSKNGGNPSRSLLLDKQGNLYGTTYGGGAYQEGTVFKLTPDGTETVLYSFGSQPGDAVSPSGAWVFDKQGNLYGTAAMAVGPAYHGVVFKLTPENTETVLYIFGAQPGDGSFPSGLVLDKDGNLYGTTEDGGATNWGTVFKLTADGTETVLYSFGSQTGDGLRPDVSLVLDNRGNLYGTNSYGGANGEGTVFKLVP